MNYMRLETPLTFRYSEFDIYDRILPAAVLAAFQDIAGEHAKTLGVGYEEMLAGNMIWVLVRSRYEIFHNPTVDTGYRLSTWPLPKEGVSFKRDFLLTDQGGEVMIKGTSVWAVTNFITRRLVRARDVDYRGESYWPEQNYRDGLTALPADDFSDLSPVFSHQVRFTDLDHNHHMNNTKYAGLILDACCPEADQVLTDLEINYLLECQLGDVIDIYRHETQSYTAVCGRRRETGQEIFRARVSLSKTPNNI